jgi:CRP-like cAMP-binding protein
MKVHNRRDENRCEIKVLQRVKNRLVEWGIPESDATEILEHHSVAAFRRGAPICELGAANDLFYWVCDGVVEIAYPLNDGDRILTRLSGPGDILGPLALPDSSGRLTNAFEVRARTGCRVAYVTNERVVRLLQKLGPETLVKLLKSALLVCAEQAQDTAKFLAMDFQQRLQIVFADLVVRFGVTEPHGTLLCVALGHRDLAEMIGSSRPIVTQLIAKMRRAGQIEQQGKQFMIISRRRAGD